MTVYKLPRVLTPQSEGGYGVTCPLLPKLVTEGDTIPQALANANDGLEAVMEAFENLGRPLPAVLQPAKEQAPLWLETIAVP